MELTTTSHHVSASESIPEIVIEPRTGWAALDLLELWRHRELAYYLAWRDVKVRYKQTILGAAWALLQPLLTMMMYTVIFGWMGGFQKFSDLPYPLVVYASLLPWQFFHYSVNTGGQSLVSSANLISKVYFPRLLVPLAAIGVGIVDLGVASILLAGLMVWYQIAPPLAILLLPALFTGLALASIGVTAWVSSLSVAYRDVRFVIPFVIQLWSFACPIIYPLKQVPERWRMLYSLNPMAGIIGGFRASLLGEVLDPVSLGVSLLSSAVIFFTGIMYFRRVEQRFADIV